MTHDELMAIPEWPTRFGQRELLHEGKRVVVPVRPAPAAMFDPTHYLDADGHEWTVGTIKGVQYRQLHRANSAVAFREEA